MLQNKRLRLKESFIISPNVIGLERGAHLGVKTTKNFAFSKKNQTVYNPSASRAHWSSKSGCSLRNRLSALWISQFRFKPSAWHLGFSSLYNSFTFSSSVILAPCLSIIYENNMTNIVTLKTMIKNCIIS